MDALKALYQGHKHRASAQTFWNIDSSRSHAIVTLELTPAYPIQGNNSGNNGGGNTTNKRTSFNLTTSEHSNNNMNTSISGIKDDHTNNNNINSNWNSNFVRLQMVDLAGSEKDITKSRFDTEISLSTSTTGAHNKSNTPYTRLSNSSSINLTLSQQEAMNIEKQENKFIRRSLSTLGYIIKALGKGNFF